MRASIVFTAFLRSNAPGFAATLPSVGVRSPPSAGSVLLLSARQATAALRRYAVGLHGQASLHSSAIACDAQLKLLFPSRESVGRSEVKALLLAAHLEELPLVGAAARRARTFEPRPVEPRPKEPRPEQSLRGPAWQEAKRRRVISSSESEEEGIDDGDEDGDEENEECEWESGSDYSIGDEEASPSSSSSPAALSVLPSLVNLLPPPSSSPKNKV